MSLGPGRHRFAGRIAGVGTTSGVRVVVGHWTGSPLGTFADVMLADRDGRRLLLAPEEEVAEFVSATYHFDQVVIGPVDASVGAGRWEVSTADLSLRLDVGARTPLGHLLHAVPTPLATAPAWSRLTDPVARRVLRGVRTRGTAGNGRREYYGATDLHRVTAASGHWAGTALGDLAPVSPEPRFGFASTPTTPSVTTITTTVEV